MIKNSYHNYAILVLSCDKYSDIWNSFFSQFYTFWPDCPFKVYLGSNTKKYKDPTVTTILSKTSENWSTDLLHILDNIKEEYIFVWMEDFFPIKKIDSKLFLKAFEFMQTSRANHMHMSPYIRPDGYCAEKLFGYYKKEVPYRVNAPGFWNRHHLQKLLIPGENPWKFEIMGSYRASYYDGYYCLNKSLFQFIRIIEKGNIRRAAFDYCVRNRIPLDTKRRHIDTMYEKLTSDILEQLFHVLVKVPWKLRVGTMNMLRRIFVSY